MQLLRKIYNCNAPVKDLKQICTKCLRSCVELSCTVWNSIKIQEKSEDLENIQKCALKIIYEAKYKSQQQALNQIEIKPIYERTKNILQKIVQELHFKSKTEEEKNFRINLKTHQLSTRYPDIARTERLRSSPIIYIQNLLNEI